MRRWPTTGLLRSTLQPFGDVRPACVLHDAWLGRSYENPINAEPSLSNRGRGYGWHASAGIRVASPWDWSPHLGRHSNWKQLESRNLE